MRDRVNDGSLDSTWKKGNWKVPLGNKDLGKYAGLNGFLTSFLAGDHLCSRKLPDFKLMLTSNY